MKKVLIVCGILFCCIVGICVFLWSNSNNNDNVRLTLDSLKDLSEELIESKLIGRDIESIQLMFGEPDATLSGMYGIIYELVKDEKNIIIYFDNNNKVNNVLLSFAEASTGKNDEDGLMKNDFQFGFLVSQEPKIVKVLSTQDLNADYNLYYYGFSAIDIMFGDDIIPLKDALLNGKITLDDIIEKAINDVEKTEKMYSNFADYQSVPRLFPYSETYKDGGSIMYYYETYNILKCNTVDGNKDVYIGIPQMSINDLFI